MKAVVDGIEFEGTPEEFSKLLKDYRQNNKTDKPQTTAHIVYEDKSEKNTNSREWHMYHDCLPNAKQFVESLFYYSPEHGGSSAALLILTTGKQYTLRSVAQRAKCDLGSMPNVIQRSIDAGCQIEIDNSKVKPGYLARGRKVTYIKDGQEFSIPVLPDTRVRYVSLGTPEQAESVAQKHRKSKSDSPEKTKYISTGSPPITKIVHR